MTELVQAVVIEWICAKSNITFSKWKLYIKFIEATWTTHPHKVMNDSFDTDRIIFSAEKEIQSKHVATR